MTRALGRRPREASATSPAHTKAHYKFPSRDFEDVHRCVILSAESRAARRHYKEVERAVALLHGMLELLPQRA
jgi:23S rRNA maturation-related 3'-5' exoribonuclease YhaM